MAIARCDICSHFVDCDTEEIRIIGGQIICEICMENGRVSCGTELE